MGLRFSLLTAPVFERPTREQRDAILFASFTLRPKIFKLAEKARQFYAAESMREWPLAMIYDCSEPLARRMAIEAAGEETIRNFESSVLAGGVPRGTAPWFINVVPFQELRSSIPVETSDLIGLPIEPPHGAVGLLAFALDTILYDDIWP